MRSKRVRAVGFALLLGCSPVPAADDEAGVTTSPGTGTELGEGESSTIDATDTTSTTDTTDTTDTNGEQEVSDLDFRDVCPCDVFAQDCPRGEKCVPFSLQGDTWDCTTCVPVQGDQAPGETCSSDGAMVGTDDCDISSWCYTWEGEGICRAFCSGSLGAPECALGSLCWLSNVNVVSVCVPPCDPVVQDCPQGTGCYWSGAIFGCSFVSPSNLSVGEPCSSVNSCAPGLHCMDGSSLPSCAGQACCSPFCDIGLGDAPCEALPGTVCAPFLDAPEGYPQVGLCALP